jgi:ligand-binding sensor domain-containing protein
MKIIRKVDFIDLYSTLTEMAQLGKILMIVGLVFCVQNTLAQYRRVDLTELNSLLPSKVVYKCLEDDRGFLWIGTENGLVRYDGKYSKLYTTKDGLPQDRVTNIIRNHQGVLWVDIYGGKIARYDPLTDKFIEPKYNNRSYVQPEIGFRFKALFATANGDLVMSNLKSNYILKGSNITTYQDQVTAHHKFLFQLNNDAIAFLLMQPSPSDPNTYLYTTKKGKLLERKLFRNSELNQFYHSDGESMYFFERKSSKVFRYYDIQTNPLRFKVDSFLTDGAHYHHVFSNEHVIKINEASQLSFYDKRSGQYQFQLQEKSFIQDIYEDRQHNLWLSGPNFGGVVLYTKHPVQNMDLDPCQYAGTLNCFARHPSGEVWMGTTAGTIVNGQGSFNVRELPDAKATAIVRHLIYTNRTWYSFGETGIYRDMQVPIPYVNKACKVAFRWKDTAILCGFRTGVACLNPKTNTIIPHPLNSLTDITAFAATDSNGFYIGTMMGLFYYNHRSNQLVSLPSSNTLLNESVVALCTAPNGLLWVSTATKGLYAYQHGKILHHVLNIGISDGTVPQCLAIGSNERIYVGTNKGIAIISVVQQKIRVNYLTKMEGLSDNNVKQIELVADSLYALTNNGYSKFPLSYLPSRPQINTVITSFKVDSTYLPVSNSYKLESNQNKITLELAGIDLSGGYNYIEFSDNGGENWNKLPNNFLNLNLSSGEHERLFRSVNINKEVSGNTLRLVIFIKTPFYKQLWFIFFLLLTATLLGLYIRGIFKRRKQQKLYETLQQQQQLDEFELQALKAQINPHFVFNCLNSIKGILYEEDFDRANTYLNKFAVMLRSTLNYSTQQRITLKDELLYCENYLELEQLRYGGQFDYFIEVDHTIDTENCRLPAMLLQPFLENALIHGIAPLKIKKGRIDIRVYTTSDTLTIDVIDNGIGRDAAAKLKDGKKKQHESKGTEITQRRLDLYNILLNVTDTKNGEDEALGTKISIQIP